MSKAKAKQASRDGDGYPKTGRPVRVPGASPVPEVDFHALQAYRNWLLAKGFLRFKLPSPSLTPGVPGDTTRATRIAESPAVSRLMQSIGDPAAVPRSPPRDVKDANTRDAAFSLSDGASLINEYLGYGETVSDEMLVVVHDKRSGSDVFGRENYVSRRTRTGRQRLEHVPQETPPAKSIPEKSLKLP